GFAEIELGIPDPSEQRGPGFEHDRCNRTSGAWQLEAVPQHESNRRGLDGPLDAHERPAVEHRRSKLSNIARSPVIERAGRPNRMFEDAGNPRVPVAHVVTALVVVAIADRLTLCRSWQL